MTVNTLGGSGSGSAALSADSSTSVTIFTLPSTADYMYEVSVLLNSSGDTSYIKFPAYGGSGRDSGYTMGKAGYRFKVGPGATIKIPIDSNSEREVYTVYFEYNYVGIKAS
jgi:hypothetical protein